MIHIKAKGNGRREVKGSSQVTAKMVKAGMLALLLSVSAPRSSATTVSELDNLGGWTQIDLGMDVTPGNRYLHTMVYDDLREVAIMHGGGPASNQWAGETWSWNGVAWELLTTNGPELVLHAMAFDSIRGVALVYGGLAPGLVPSAETWEWDGQRWLSVAQSSGPGPAVGPAMAYDPIRKRVILHGGHSDTRGDRMLSKTWEWDGSYWMEVAEGPARAAHRIVYDTRRQVFVLFGGFSARGSAPEDTWEYDGHQWQQVSTEGPPGRLVHLMAYDVARGVTVMTCGGHSPAAGFGQRVFFNDTWEWNGHVWTEVSNHGLHPPAHFGPDGTYDSNRRRIVLFGGTATGSVGTQETWEFKGLDLHRPHPADELQDVYRDESLSWTPVADDVVYNVYFGHSLERVQNAGISNPLDVLVSQEQAETSIDPGRLDFEQTYYWRVDEVNLSPDRTVSKGNVWRFTTEPFAYQVTHIKATASSTFGSNAVPENTINGSGLTDDGHGGDLHDMWLSGSVPAWISYEFDRPYQLHEVLIWNSNQLIESTLGFGAKDVVIEHSPNGVDWTVFNAVTQLAQAPGTANYTPNNVIGIEGTLAKHVRITINSTHGMASQTGLSEVRFFHVPVFARYPQPANGTTENSLDTTLSWRPSREAAMHQVVFSDNKNAVIGDTAVLGTTIEPIVNLYDQELKYGITYFWKINEVNDLETPSVHNGNLWHFHTPQFNTVDDMEFYRDQELLEIWAYWVDGLGNPDNGSIVGNETVFGSYAPEENLVQEGRQSLPMMYDNSVASASETTRTFDPPLDWNRGQPEVLSLYFVADPEMSRGDLLNDLARVYVIVKDSAGSTVQVIYPDPAATHLISWTEWQIPLSELDTLDLSSIQSMTIGIGGDGDIGKGKMYFDNIRVGTPGSVDGTP